MFYLTKRVDEKQCTPGERIMVLSDFSGVPAGHKGTVVEIYGQEWSDGGGITIEWDCRPGHPEDIRRKLRDGFGRDDLQYLAFCTLKHPKVDPTVYRVEIE